MNGWQSTRISDFCSTGSGGTPSRGDAGRYYDGGTIPWIKSGELRESVITKAEEHITEAAVRESSVKLVPSGALLLAMYGATVGRLGILGIQATTNQAVCHIIPDPNVANTRFLFHALSEQVPAIVARGVGGAQPNISQGIIRDLKIPLPPLPEQRRIAEVLDRVEGLRAKRREVLISLDNLSQAIFLEMFGDPDVNPLNFPFRKIRDLLLSASYGTSEKSLSIGTYPVLRMNNITRTGEMDFTDLKYMEIDSGDLERYLVKPGDILFNRTNSAELVGKTGVFRDSRAMAYAGYLIRLRVNKENDPEYLGRFLNSAYAKRMLRGMCKSIIGMANINATEIQNMDIAQPPLNLQKEFARRIATVERLKATHRASLVQLDALFASLQHRAFRGEL
jgi:type I restriction enzyme, S subunit